MSADYTELALNVAAQTGINDLPPHFARLVEMAERDIFKHLRVGSMIKEASVDVSAGVAVDLPADLLELESVRCPSLGDYEQPELDRVPDSDLRAKRRMGFAVTGKKLLVYPSRDSVIVEYYAKPEGLQAAIDGTNWLLDLEPEIYLHAVAFQAYVWKMQQEKAAMSKAYYRDLIEDMTNEDIDQRFKNQKETLKGDRP